MYKCARVLEMAIAPITHYAINITLTKVNRALVHDQLVQEGVVSMHMSYAMCKKGWSRLHMPYAMCTGECWHDTCPRTCADRLWGIAQVHHARARFTCAMPQSLSAQVHQHLHV